MDSVSLLGSAFWLGVGAVFTFLVPIVLLVVLLVRRMVSSKPLALRQRLREIERSEIDAYREY